MVVKSAVLQGPEARTYSLRGLNGFAAMICSILMVIAIILAPVMSAAGVPAGWIVVMALGFWLIGLYILLALRIAKQWEKAIVCALDVSEGLRGQVRSGSSRSWMPFRRLWTTA